MDEIARYNIERWQALTRANAVFTRPYLNLDAASARERLDHTGRLGEIAGKNVLCLASGGGQQSAAFAVLGANVTVFDLSEEQLQRDWQVSAHYHFEIKTIQGDMRDLSCLPAACFDIVWHAYSINFVPNAREVFGQVARVIRRGGVYRFNFANPFTGGLDEKDWNGEGYVLKQPYREGVEIISADASWVHSSTEPIPCPREYHHTLSTLVNGLIEHGFVIRHLSDDTDFDPDPNAAPATWEHLISIAPPWLTLWTTYEP